MSIETKLKLARFATKCGWIDEEDWKTPKIISRKYRNSVQKKAFANAYRTGKKLFK